MAKQQNMMLYVIIALIIGGAIGYALAGGFTAGGKASNIAIKTTVCSAGYTKICDAAGKCSCVRQVSTATATDESVPTPPGPLVSCNYIRTGGFICSGSESNQYNCDNGGTYCCSGSLGTGTVTCTRA